MRRYLIGLALIALGTDAYAQTCAAPPADPVPRDAARLTWTAPTQNTDGTAVKTPITFTVYEGTVAKCTTTQTSAGLTGLSVGLHTYTVTAKTSDGESAKSNAASKTIPPAPPNPPTNLTVNPDQLVAYGISQTPDKLTTFPVGTVAANTACDGAMSVNGLYRVPRASVTWAGNVTPAVVFAQCNGS